MITFQHVTAVIVTRGDHPDYVQEVADSLPYGEVIIWDNGQHAVDNKVYGRYLAAERASNDVIYFQDDDIRFTAHEELCAAYQPDRVTCNMPDEWWFSSMYPVWNCCMVGAGSLVPKGLWREPLARYLAEWPADDLFTSHCDSVFGCLVPFTRLNLGYEIQPWALAPGRICTTPGAHEWRMTLMNRVFALRGTRD